VYARHSFALARAIAEAPCFTGNPARIRQRLVALTIGAGVAEGRRASKARRIVMKKVLVALVCTLGAVACGERRPAEDPSTTSTSVTTETTTVRPTTTNTNGVTSTTSSTPRTTTTGSADGLDTTRPIHNDAMSGAATGGAGSTAPATTGAGTAPSTDNPGVADGTKDATNTKINDRDRHGALTPMDQGGGADRDITAAIRRSVVADKALSFTAKNVKIITVGGKVTLRGPVKSDDEKSAIEAKAKAAPGVSSVDNQLEVKK
jgi:hyperosmotically inducible protein